MPSCQTMTYELHHASLGNILNTSSVSKMSFEAPLVGTGDIVSENLHRFHADNFSNKPQTSDKSIVFTAVTQAIEQLGSAEESIITIIVPEDLSGKQAFLTNQPILQDHQFTEEENLEVEHGYESDGAEESSEMEHSYCRLDLDRNQLWETIAKLQSKVALLEVQENVTLARLRSLEALFGQLKQENLLSDEKLKIIDNCQNSFDFAIVQ
ncbi:THAP domain-containing protein 5 [Bufo gargarizans]|uniref:THAP domain-containing protein 5 n=1 Tax=Bufo gargarizans TaxID=30331 RepID=UPI001CF24F96|nr:THAP domain-containing protein 5 [Bufo gargarizans]